eukprot:CAMPEP_0197453566 /NCGR_PEP_ID=MMETSP1175-20131217/35288_1 /TAXON_ID=1003142 /ORGANISM="Triceratium dubium, Strain CCMP147" /LENGTH=51 /DNA_ID=CAMNT_0042986891 /DNA_START=96 /DNA_END=248 /DNA_ORIENTATION=-
MRTYAFRLLYAFGLLLSVLTAGAVLLAEGAAVKNIAFSVANGLGDSSSGVM